MKEAIKRLRSIGEKGMLQSDYREVSDSLALYRQDLELVLHTPTVDELCKTLSVWFKESKYHSYISTVFYSEKGKYFYTEDENRNLVEMIFDNYYIHEISPHLITLIGRFYEGVEVKE